MTKAALKADDVSIVAKAEKTGKALRVTCSVSEGVRSGDALSDGTGIGRPLCLPVFASGRVPALIMTTTAGEKRLIKQKIPDSVQIRPVRNSAREIPAGAILEELSRENPGRRILVEGGPRLLGTFYSERLIDEQFLTLAPQIAGRDIGDARLGLVMGKTFAPRHPLWGTLIDARRGARLLFLRYSFAAA